MTPSVINDRAKDLVTGHYGLYQPSKDSYTPISPAEIDLVVVPGVAFTEHGVRLGRGGGYYDTFLKGLPRETATVGIAFALQLVAELPQCGHDAPVTKLITEVG